MNEVPEVFPAYRLVAEFADGQRLAFDGLTEQQAQDRMEAAQARHGDICWYDGVTDQHYENGKYYKLAPQPPEIIVIDLTDCPDEPEKEDCPYPKASAATTIFTTPNATASAPVPLSPSATPSAPPPRPPGKAYRRMCCKPAKNA